MRVRNVSSLVGVIGLLAGAPAAVQAQPEAAEPETDIVVEAPRFLPVPPEDLPSAPVTKALATVKISVLYQDLDLSRPADAGRLMERIERTARQACDYLDLLYPLDDDPDCAKRAAATATPAAKAAIAAAAGSAEGAEKQ